MKTIEYVYRGRDNSIDLVLKSGLPGQNPAPVNLSSVRRMTLEFGTTVIDSTTSRDAFDWSGGDGSLVLSLGDQNIPAGKYQALLTVYDDENMHGIVWGRLHVVVE
jgi:hypothetical protein